jgi:hypothetical protein
MTRVILCIDAVPVMAGNFHGYTGELCSSGIYLRLDSSPSTTQNHRGGYDCNKCDVCYILFDHLVPCNTLSTWD